MLGQTLVEYWLAHFAAAGAKRVLVLSSDRPEEVEAVVASGGRWGLAVKVIAETRELTAGEALAKYSTQICTASEQAVAEVLDHFPLRSQPALFGGYADFFRALRNWLPEAITPDRVGTRQLCPGVWCGANSRISPGARLRAPCWVGQYAVISRGAILGPGSIVEDGAFVDRTAEIAASWIAPHTFVGRLARIRNSLALGNWLVNWQTGSSTCVPDPFVLSALWKPQTTARRSWFRRLSQLHLRHKPEPALAWNGLVTAKQKLTHESCSEH